MSSNLRIVTVAALLAALTPLGAALGSDDGPPFLQSIQRRTLDNGLEAVVVQMPTPGVAAVVTWMAVGSRDEIDEGRTGFAHFFEHLMFLGTPTWSGDAREGALLERAADDNAWTWWDDTVYHLVVPSQHVPFVLELEADRFQHLQLTPDDVRREAGAVLGEWRKGSTSPAAKVEEALGDAAFDVHTYGHDTIGLEADILAMPTAHAYASTFFDRLYRPGNARVIVAGDVDASATFAAIDAAYGSWTPATEPRPEVPAEPPQEGLRRVDVPWPHPTAPYVAFGWRIPASSTTDPDVAGLALAEQLLVSEVGSLTQTLVRDEGLAFGVWGGRDDTVDPGLFRLVVAVKPDADLAEVERIVKGQVAALAEPIEADRLQAQQDHAVSAFMLSLADPRDVAMTVGWSMRRDAEPGALGRWIGQLTSATPETVAGAVGRHLVDDHLTIATLTHTEEVAP